MEIWKKASRYIAGNQAQKKLHMCYIECMFCFQSLQYSSIHIFLLLFEEVGA